MTQKENFYAMLEGKNPEFAPVYTEMYKTCNFVDDIIDHPRAGGRDGFGINWTLTKDGIIPEPGVIIFEDICDWKEYVKLPNLDDIDMMALAEEELAGIDRNEKVINVNNFVGLFERMVAYMGFENTFIALLEEPEACDEFFRVIADFKIECINRMIDAYQPDAVTYFDDLATARSLFMSPETYRKLIKPHHKRIVEAINSRGVICAHHICGKCEDIIDEFVEMGIRIWNSAQTMNDLTGIQKKYASRLLIEGGWDSSGRPGCVDATMDEILKEADRCITTYGKFGNFILFPVIMNERGNAVFVGDERLDKMLEYWHEHSYL